jgi:hypothetical protein
MSFTTPTTGAQPLALDTRIDFSTFNGKPMLTGLAIHGFGWQIGGNHNGQVSLLTSLPVWGGDVLLAKGGMPLARSIIRGLRGYDYHANGNKTLPTYDPDWHQMTHGGQVTDKPGDLVPREDALEELRAVAGLVAEKSNQQEFRFGAMPPCYMHVVDDALVTRLRTALRKFDKCRDMKAKVGEKS